MTETFWGILIPFLGTSLGAACVFFMQRALGDLVQRSLAGFAAGVMVAASVWSLLIPAIEQSEKLGRFAFFPAFAGLWFGVLFLLALDHLIPHLHVGSEEAEGPKSRLGRTTMMVLAVTLHNIPEGMAVGVMYAGFLAGSAQITAASALALSLPVGDEVNRAFALTGLMAFAMGFRNATVRKLGVPDMTTTLVTLTLADLASDSFLAGRRNPRLGRRLGVVLALFSGSLIGGALIVLRGISTALLACCAVALVLTTAYSIA